MQTQKGITLISLVITIILLLILAGVTINFAIGENGIFKLAENATEKYENSQTKEYQQLAELNNELETWGVRETTTNEWKKIENSEITITSISASTYSTKNIPEIIGAKEILIVFSDTSQLIIYNVNNNINEFNCPRNYYLSSTWNMHAYGTVNFSNGEIKFLNDFKGTADAYISISSIYYR